MNIQQLENDIINYITIRGFISHTQLIEILLRGMDNILIPEQDKIYEINEAIDKLYMSKVIKLIEYRYSNSSTVHEMYYLASQIEVLES